MNKKFVEFLGALFLDLSYQTDFFFLTQIIEYCYFCIIVMQMTYNCTYQCNLRLTVYNTHSKKLTTIYYWTCKNTQLNLDGPETAPIALKKKETYVCIYMYIYVCVCIAEICVCMHVCESYWAVSSGGDTTHTQVINGPWSQSLTHTLCCRTTVRYFPLVCCTHTHTKQGITLKHIHIISCCFVRISAVSRNRIPLTTLCFCSAVDGLRMPVKYNTLPVKQHYAVQIQALFTSQRKFPSRSVLCFCNA